MDQVARPSPLYHAAVVLVGVAMVLLPCIYLAQTIAASVAVYYFATEHFVAIWRWPIGVTKVALIAKIVCSFTPLLVGGAIALFMVKPLFARRKKRMQPLALNPAVEPRVYELVQAVCREVGAPAPHRIELDCDLNASAHFDGGLRGLCAGRLILTLGMPLVAGLTERELAGVIAHEFGHFRQGVGMRMSYLCRRVNGWFARVVYERDEWDEALSSWDSGDGGWVGLMLGCARFGVWISRGLLWILMTTGHAVSCLLMRQMEFDADAVSVRIAGTAAFESSTYQMASLSAIMREVDREMARLWRRQLQLPDNLPVLVEYRASRLSPAERQKLEGTVGFEKTGLLDTHPCAAERVRQARQLAQPGLPWSDLPARQLFENFEMVSRLVTLAHYEDDLDVPTTPDFLVPLEAVIRGKTEAAAKAPAAPAPVPMMSYDPNAFRPKPDAAG